MTADDILKKYEDDNECHFHTVDRQWIIAAMEEYAALRQHSIDDNLVECTNCGDKVVMISSGEFCPHCLC